MALSGSFTTGETQGLTSIYVEGVWSATQNVSANTSSVTLSAYLWHWELSNRSQPVTLTVDGQSYTLNAPSINTGDVWQRTFLGSRTFTVSHGADGSKTLGMSVDYNAKISYSGKDLQHITQTASGIILDTIPRASGFASVPSSVTAGNALDIVITPASSAFTHKLIISAGTKSYTASAAAGVKTFRYSIPASWADEFPTAMSGSGLLTLETYNGSAKIGSVQRPWTLNVPAYTMSASFSSAISGNSTAASWGTYIKGITKASLTGSVSTSYGASIVSLSISGGGYSKSASGTSLSFTTGFLNAAGTVPFTLSAVDSRGKSVSRQLSLSVYDYAQPSLSSVSAFRSDSARNPNPAGLYITAGAAYACSSVGGKNSIVSATVQYKLVSSSSYTTGLASFASGASTAFGAGKIDLNSSYDVLFTVRDSLGAQASSSVSVPTQEVPLSFYPRNKGVTVGGVSEKAGFISKYAQNEFAGNVTVSGTLNGLRVGGKTWPQILTAASDGVTDVGKALDFHPTSGDSADYGARISLSGNTLVFSGPIQAGSLSGRSASTGSGTMNLYAENNNEINFGGSNTGTIIHVGSRAKDSRPKPTEFVFAGGDAALSCKTLTLKDPASARSNLGLKRQQLYSGSTAGAIQFSPAAFDLLVIVATVGSNTHRDCMTIPAAYYSKYELENDLNQYYGFELSASGISACTGGSGAVNYVLGIKCT